MADKDFALQVTNGSKDLQTIEDFVNLPAGSVVKPRLLPSVDVGTLAGIRDAIFKAGGLPATPFKTKALMTASALVDGKYAMVTDDTVNNGLYVKTAGAWVKSDYDPLAQAKTDASIKDEATLASAKKYSDKNSSGDYGGVVVKIDIPEKTKGSYDKTGSFVVDNNISTTDFISVKEGECYVLDNLKEDSVSIYSFSLFDSSKNFVGVVGGHRLRNSDYSTEQKLFSNGVGTYNSESSIFTSGVIIPTNGFIKVSYRVTGATSFANLNNKPTSLLKVGYEDFTKLTATALPSNVMAKFKGVFKSALVDKGLIGNGIGTTQTVGEPTSYNGIGHAVSKRIAVKEGQFIHLHTSSRTHYHDVVFEDADGNYLGSNYVVTEYSIPTASVGSEYSPISLRAPLNVRAPFTGFFRVHSSVDTSVPFLVGITDSKVSYPRNMLTRRDNSLVFNPALGNLSSYKITDTFNNTGIFSTIRAKDNVNSSHTASIPYVLKKGDVVEYSSNATNSPLLAMVIAYGKEIPLSTFIGKKDLAVPLLANEVVSIEQTQAWLSAGKPTNPNYFADASKGTIAYCNEDTDVIIVFYRPNKLNPDYATFKQNQGYDISVMTQDEYKVKRNLSLKDRFKQISGFKAKTDDRDVDPWSVSASQVGRATFPSVLMFRGEVINYLTTGYAESTSRELSEIDVLDNHGVNFTNIGGYYRIAVGPLSLDLPIKSTNPLSSVINQIYCHKTGNVYLGLAYLNSDGAATLDVENIIKGVSFTPKIVTLEDAEIGVDLTPCLFIGNQSKYSEDIQVFSTGYNGALDSIATFLGKNKAIEASYWGNTTQQVVVSGELKSGMLADKIRPIYNPDGDEEYALHTSQGSPSKVGYAAKANSFVAVSSRTKGRNTTDMLAAGSQLAYDVIFEDVPAGIYNMDKFYTLSMQGMPVDEVREKYKVTDKTYFDLPYTKDITFNFCTLTGSSSTDAHYALLQILVEGKVVLVVNALTENQGQSTAGSLRRNVNIEMYNDKFKKVYIKFGEAIEQYEIVLKSYLNTDKGHFKDTLANDLWYKMRHVDPYPIGGVIPTYMFEDLTIPTNQVARSSVYAFPVTQNRGDSFYGLATLKFKKKRENYAMDKTNLDHILLQADWQLGAGGQLDWSNPSLTKMEVREPSMDGYTAGDATLPVKYAGVESNITRILDWLKGVYTGTVDARSTYKDFVNLDSLIDYAISIAVTYNVDGRTNNFMMGTHDGTIWDFYSYDTDQTWGSFNNTKVHHRTMTSGDVFSSVLTKLAPEVKARYAKQRREGVIDIKRIQSQIVELNSYMSATKKEMDIEYWGEWNETAGIPYVMGWAYSRINFLDAYFGYIEPNSGVIAQGVRNLSTLASGASKDYTYTNTPASVGDLLAVEFGESLKGTTMTANCLVNGTIIVTHNNLTSEAVTIPTSYLRIKRV